MPAPPPLAVLIPSTRAAAATAAAPGPAATRRKTTMATSKVNLETTVAEVADLPRIDEAIASVERLYQALTGSQAPPTSEEPDAPIPVEKDAAEFVTERLDRLIDALGQSLGQPGAQGEPAGTPATETAWSPPIAVWENADGLMVHLDVPGVSR